MNIPNSVSNHIIAPNYNHTTTQTNLHDPSKEDDMKREKGEDLMELFVNAASSYGPNRLLSEFIKQFVNYVHYVLSRILVSNFPLCLSYSFNLLLWTSRIFLFIEIFLSMMKIKAFNFLLFFL